MRTIPELLAHRARAAPTATTLIDEATAHAVSANQLTSHVTARARALVAGGVAAGDRVAILLPNSLA